MKRLYLVCVVFGVFGSFLIGRAQSDVQTLKPLHDVSENIVRHLERTHTTGGTMVVMKLTPEDRIKTVALIEDILVLSLHDQGYVRVEFANGRPLHWKRDE